MVGCAVWGRELPVKSPSENKITPSILGQTLSFWGIFLPRTTFKRYSQHQKGEIFIELYHDRQKSKRLYLSHRIGNNWGDLKKNLRIFIDLRLEITHQAYSIHILWPFRGYRYHSTEVVPLAVARSRIPNWKSKKSRQSIHHNTKDPNKRSLILPLPKFLHQQHHGSYQ